MVPAVDSAVKSGAMSLMRTDMGKLLSMSLVHYIRALEQGFTPQGHIA
jgi:hypothetical protein